MTSERGTFFRTTQDDERATFYGERSPIGWHGPSAEQLAAALEAQCSAIAMGASGEDAERQQAASLLIWQAGEIQALRAHVVYFAGLRTPEAREPERVLGMTVLLDPTMPPDEIRMGDGTPHGSCVIKNVMPPVEPEGGEI